MTRPNDQTDQKVVAVVSKSSLLAAGAMFAIPIPVADMGAVYGIWAKMIHDIAAEYGAELSMKDAQALAKDIFQHVILGLAAWFGTVKTAMTILKVIPGAGTITAYAVDAAIASFGIKKITARLGLAAAAYFKSGGTRKPGDLLDEIAEVPKDTKVLVPVLAAISPVLDRTYRKRTHQKEP